MKNKFVLSVLVLVLGMYSSSFAQEKEKAKALSDVVWLGVDFTSAKFTAIMDDPGVIVNQYLKSINTLILAEPEKYNIKKFFNKSIVTNDIDPVNEKNSKIDPTALLTSNEYKIDPTEISQIIKNCSSQEKSGTGLIFIAENLNKSTQTGSYYVCFFDIATKVIIDCRRIVGKAVGIGFRNYWAGSVYNCMKIWAEDK